MHTLGIVLNSLYAWSYFTCYELGVVIILISWQGDGVGGRALGLCRPNNVPRSQGQSWTPMAKHSCAGCALHKVVLSRAGCIMHVPDLTL